MPGKLLRWCLGMCLAVCAHASGWAVPLQLTHALGSVPLQARLQYWVEPGRSLTVDQVEAQAGSLPWAVRDDQRLERLGDRTAWFRFEAVITDQDRWYLTIGSPGLDRAQLFYRGPDGAWVVQEAGGSRPVSAWPVPGRVPTFELSPVAGQPVTYWVRAEQRRVHFGAPLTLHNQAQLLVVREREQFLLGAYFGLAVLLTVVSLAHAVGGRDRNFAAYALYLVLFTLWQATYIGVGAQHLWVGWLQWNRIAMFMLPALSAAAALWFVQVVTEPARFSRPLNRFVWATIAALVVTAAVEAILPNRLLQAVRLNLITLTLLLVAVLIALVWRKGDDRGIRLIALGFLPVLLGALLPLARAMNLLPDTLLTRYGIAVASALEMPILFYALSKRAALRREGAVRAAALSHTDALTGLEDRRRLLQRMEASLGRARGQKHSCGLLVLRLANHDAIAGEHGREILDRALVMVASHLRRCASDIDLAARVGEREFALLVEGPTTPDAISARAQQLIAAGLRPSAALPGELTLRLQIVSALLPDPNGDAAASLQWALAALGGMRADERKPIRALNF